MSTWDGCVRWVTVLVYTFLLVGLYCNNEDIMVRLSSLGRACVLGMVQAGISREVVARHFNVHRSTISRLLSRYRDTTDVKDLARSGRPRVTDTDRRIVGIAAFTRSKPKFDGLDRREYLTRLSEIVSVPETSDPGDPRKCLPWHPTTKDVDFDGAEATPCGTGRNGRIS